MLAGVAPGVEPAPIVPGHFAQLGIDQPSCRVRRVQRAWEEVQYSYRIRGCLLSLKE